MFWNGRGDNRREIPWIIVERCSSNARLEGQVNYIRDKRADHIYIKAQSALIHAAHVNQLVKSRGTRSSLDTSMNQR